MGSEAGGLVCRVERRTAEAGAEGGHVGAVAVTDCSLRPGALCGMRARRARWTVLVAADI